MINGETHNIIPHYRRAYIQTPDPVALRDGPCVCVLLNLC